MDQDFRRELPPSGPSDRSFGLTFAAFFALIGLIPLVRRHQVRWWAVAISVAFVLASIAAPRILHPLNLVWMRLAALLGRVTCPIAMAFVFYVVVTPIGWILRMLGKDPMLRRFDPEAHAAETGAKTLCLAGGVALNCVANGKLARAGYFDRSWIQPAAGDAGGALGAALAAYRLNRKRVYGFENH